VIGRNKSPIEKKTVKKCLNKKYKTKKKHTTPK